LPSKRMVGTYHPNNFFFDGDVVDGELSSAREANSGPFDMKRVNKKIVLPSWKDIFLSRCFIGFFKFMRLSVWF